MLLLSMMTLITGFTCPSTIYLLQSATSVITKCDRYYKVWQFYYKVRRVLQSATIITKCDSTRRHKLYSRIVVVILFLHDIHVNHPRPIDSTASAAWSHLFKFPRLAAVASVSFECGLAQLRFPCPLWLAIAFPISPVAGIYWLCMTGAHILVIKVHYRY